VGVPSYVRDPPSHAPLCTRDSIQGKRKKRNDEGQQVAAEKKRRRKGEKTEKKREAAVRRREREKNRVFLTATSIRDWGFVCGPILMKF
jgi:hypothetical protein